MVDKHFKAVLAPHNRMPCQYAEPQPATTVQDVDMAGFVDDARRYSKLSQIILWLILLRKTPLS